MLALKTRNRALNYFLMIIGTAVVTVSLSGCFAPSKTDDALLATVPASEPAQPSASPTEEPYPGMEEAFLERDAFLKAQQLPIDGSPLVAVTDAQKKLVDDQQAVTESHGGVWTAQHESLLLAMASDTCETGILNQHKIDGALLQSHLETSPILPVLVPADAVEEQKAHAIQGAAGLMATSAGYLCPDDKALWSAAYAELYPEWRMRA